MSIGDTPMKNTFLALSIVVTGTVFAQSVYWEFSESVTNGGEIHWTSPTAVDPNSDQYQYVYEITYIGADVEFLGIEFGPFDVTDQVDPKLRQGKGLQYGPAPIILADMPIEADADNDGELDVSAWLMMQLSADGRGNFDVVDVSLNSIVVDLGFPFYEQEVDLVRVYMDGNVNLEPIELPCPGDTNDDGVINVTDILNAISNWGNSGEGDINGDGIVNVSDILEMVSNWGPCN